MLSNCPGTNFGSIVRNDGGLLKGWALAQNLLMDAPAAVAIGAGECLEPSFAAISESKKILSLELCFDYHIEI